MTADWRWQFVMGLVWVATGIAGVIVASGQVPLQVVAGFFFFLGGAHVTIALDRRTRDA